MPDVPAVISGTSLDAVLRPVRGGNAYEEAVGRVMQLIRLGLVAHGERLPPERELAQRMGISRVTLRSVIRALQQAGYVESRRGRHGGSFVTWRPGLEQADARTLARQMGDQLVDALAFRAVVEPGAAALAAARPLSLAERHVLAERLDEASSATAESYRPADTRFHLAIAELSGSATLTAAVADVQVRLNELLRAIPLLEPAITHSRRQHTAIADAIFKGRPAAARAAMEEHIEATAALLHGFLG